MRLSSPSTRWLRSPWVPGALLVLCLLTWQSTWCLVQKRAEVVTAEPVEDRLSAEDMLAGLSQAPLTLPWPRGLSAQQARALLQHEASLRGAMAGRAHELDLSHQLLGQTLTGYQKHLLLQAQWRRSYVLRSQDASWLQALKARAGQPDEETTPP